MFSSSLNCVFINLFFLLTSLYSVNAVQMNETSLGLDVNTGGKNVISLIGRTEAIRHKRIALFNINVYQARLFLPEKEAKNKIAKDLLETFPKAVKINPMRSFSGDRLKEAMLVSYEKNNVSLTSKAQEEFLDLISKHKIQKNNPVYLVGIVNGDKEELHLIMKNMNEVIYGQRGFLEEVFSVWLGKPVDSDMAKLQDIIIN